MFRTMTCPPRELPTDFNDLEVEEILTQVKRHWEGIERITKYQWKKAQALFIQDRKGTTSSHAGHRSKPCVMDSGTAKRTIF